MSSRRLALTPGGSNADISWSTVDPMVRRQTWTQVCSVSSGSGGQFTLSIRLRERDPTFRKPLTGGYSETKISSVSLQWQSNGDLSGVLKYNYTSGTDDADQSQWLLPSIPVRADRRAKIKAFPKDFRDASGQIGFISIWGNGCPPTTYLGDLLVTVTTIDKYPHG